ncbi:rhomboid family intramembrane serine protease [Sporolactobacillus spathodeae]|uniref:Membrane associated rhomboid family serine protease n=1 Tax=Sporolactobacillus spathodeae TaxID=1465502 RepID=A0ABS2QB08_9BACL|nr:rhomboid family intramembrane serine protease [Sporolactobacillus spathodeae]MBM7658945.1 membrane associated rhomboid family serine protease [Sporolactobacillus spathodeae]
MFIRNEPFKLFLKLYPITSIILIVNIAIYLMLFLCTYFHLAPDFAYAFIVIFGRTRAALDNGWWWQVITPVFLHTDFAHILFNAFSIFIFAPALEALLGKLRFSVIYLSVGVISNTLSLFLEPGVLSYGASTAIYGLFGIYLFLILFHKERMNRQDRLVVLVFLIINLVFSFTDSRIDVIGHFTGLLAGLILAPLFFIHRLKNYQ